MKLLYDNLFAKDTLAGYVLTKSTETSGFEAANIADWLDFDFWKPSASGASYVEVQFTNAQAADTLAIFAHDIYTNGGSIKAKRYDGGAWTQVGATLTPTSNGMQIIQFASVSDTRWRIEVTSTPASKLGVGFIGLALALPAPLRGFQPPLVPGSISMINRAEGGPLLGIYGNPNIADIAIDMEWQTPAWVRANWVPFMQHAQRRAFILAWNDSDLSEAWWCWSEKPMPNPSYETADWMDVKLECKATDGL